MKSGSKSRNEEKDPLKIIQSGAKECQIKKSLLKLLRSDNSLLNKRYLFDRSLFHYIVMHKLVDVATAILTHKAFKEFKAIAFIADRRNQTVLHYAVKPSWYSKEMFQLLSRELSMLVNVVDSAGHTPLHVAVINDNQGAASLLVFEGKADIYRQDFKEKLPIDYAKPGSTLQVTLMRLDLGDTNFRNAFPTVTHKVATAIDMGALTERFSNLNLSPSSTERSIEGSKGSSSKSSPSGIGGGSSSDSRYSPEAAGSSSESHSPDSLSGASISYLTDSITPSPSASPMFGRTKKTSDQEKKRIPTDSVRLDSSASSLRRSVSSADDTIADTTSTMSEDGFAEQTFTGDISLDDLRDGNDKKLFMYLSLGGDPNKVVFLGRRLITQSFIYASMMTEEDSGLLERRKDQFFQLLGYACLHDVADREAFVNLASKRAGSLPLLEAAMQKLFFSVKMDSYELNSHLQSSSQFIEKKLFKAGLGRTEMSVLPTRDYETLSIITKIDKKIIKLLDQLCACMETDGGARAFNKARLSLQSLGLCGLVEPTTIVRHLAALFPHFDKHQKLTALFIVKELLLSDIHHDFTKTIKMSLRLRRLKEVCLADAAFADEVGREVFGVIDCIYDHKVKFANSIPVVNYQTLLQSTRDHVDQASSMPVEDLINKHLVSGADGSSESIEMMASELRTLSVMFYQDLRLSELYGEGWKKGDKDERAPNIVKQLQQYSACTNWVVDTLLKLPPDDMPHAINFFACVIKQLSKPQLDLGPDLNAVMKVAGGLERGVIDRLKHIHEQLPEDMMALHSEALALASGANNYRWLRALYAHSPNALMFIAVITKDVINCNENEDLLHLVDTLGGVFKEILMMQSQIQFLPSVPRTNLKSVLDSSYQGVSEEILVERQYQSSYRVLPLASERVFDISLIDSVPKLFSILSDMTERKQFPHVLVVSGKEYPLGCFAPIMIDVFHFHNNKLPDELKTSNLKTMAEFVAQIELILKNEYHRTANTYLNRLKLMKHTQSQSDMKKTPGVGGRASYGAATSSSIASKGKGASSRPLHRKIFSVIPNMSK